MFLMELCNQFLGELNSVMKMVVFFYFHWTCFSNIGLVQQKKPLRSMRASYICSLEAYAIERQKEEIDWQMRSKHCKGSLES